MHAAQTATVLELYIIIFAGLIADQHEGAILVGDRGEATLRCVGCYTRTRDSCCDDESGRGEAHGFLPFGDGQ